VSSEALAHWSTATHCDQVLLCIAAATAAAAANNPELHQVVSTTSGQQRPCCVQTEAVHSSCWPVRLLQLLQQGAVSHREAQQGGTAGGACAAAAAVWLLVWWCFSVAVRASDVCQGPDAAAVGTELQPGHMGVEYTQQNQDDDVDCVQAQPFKAAVRSKSAHYSCSCTSCCLLLHA
jgi:hypothetical protein